MEVCPRNDLLRCTTTRNWLDSLNHWIAGKTASDFSLISKGLSVVGLFDYYPAWIQSFAAYDYKCTSESREAASKLLDASWFEDSLKAFQEAPEGLDPTPILERVVRGCCQCEPHSMPEFFNQAFTDAGFADNKHERVQIAISAIKDTEVTFPFPLLLFSLVLAVHSIFSLPWMSVISFKIFFRIVHAFFFSPHFICSNVSPMRNKNVFIFFYFQLKKHH